MGRKNNAPKFRVWDSVDTTTSPTSQKTSVHQIDHISYDLVYDNTVNANLTVEYCNDADNTPTSEQEWLPINFGSVYGTVIPLVGATDTETNIVFREMPYKALRLVLSNNGGTGNITADISGQSRGA